MRFDAFPASSPQAYPKMSWKTLAFPAPRVVPFEEFPSPAAAPHHCGRCPLAIAACSIRSSLCDRSRRDSNGGRSRAYRPPKWANLPRSRCSAPTTPGSAEAVLCGAEWVWSSAGEPTDSIPASQAKPESTDRGRVSVSVAAPKTIAPSTSSVARRRRQRRFDETADFRALLR